MAAPRPGVHPQHPQHPQQQQSYSASHPPAQFRHEVDDREMADAGRDRDRDRDRDRAPRVTGGGSSGGGYAGYEGRSARSEAAMDQDTFGFMAPCWRLLERAKAYMDEVCTLCQLNSWLIGHFWRRVVQSCLSWPRCGNWRLAGSLGRFFLLSLEDACFFFANTNMKQCARGYVCMHVQRFKGRPTLMKWPQQLTGCCRGFSLGAPCLLSGAPFRTSFCT